jgi:hypothetical protein
MREGHEWGEEIAARWRAALRESCEICGGPREIDGVTGYFELERGGYWTCPICFEREMTLRREKLHYRGCRRAYLYEGDTKKPRQGWVILPEPPWIKPLTG